MNEDQGPDVVKWYTRARKFPVMIGRTLDGAKLPFGPYTVTQAVTAGVILFVGLNTMSLWARFGFVGNALILTTVLVVVVWSLGRIPVGSRSPLSVVAGITQAVSAPTHGRLAGRPVRIRRPQQLRHRVVFAVSLEDLSGLSGLSGLSDMVDQAGSLEDGEPASIAAGAAPDVDVDEARTPAKGRHLRRPLPPRRQRHRGAPQAPIDATTDATTGVPAAALAPQHSAEASVVAAASPQRPAGAPLTAVQALLASATRPSGSPPRPPAHRATAATTTQNHPETGTDR